MRSKRFAATLAAFAASTLPAHAAGTPANLVASGDIDFYVLTLSSSPRFCDTGGAAKSTDQCAADSGDGFVVHGLWPDNLNCADQRAKRLAQLRPDLEPAGSSRMTASGRAWTVSPISFCRDDRPR